MRRAGDSGKYTPLTEIQAVARSKADRSATITIRVIVSIVLSLLLAASLAALFVPNHPQWLSFLATASAAIFLMVTIVKNFIGGHVIHWLQPLEKWLANWLFPRHLGRTLMTNPRFDNDAQRKYLEKIDVTN